MSACLSVEIIDCFASLERLTEDWWDLWQRSPNATPFQSPAWLLPWWHHFSPGRLAVIVVRRRHRLVGLAPLYFEEMATTRRLLPLGISLSDHLDVLIDPSEASLVARTLGAVLAHDLDWTSCEFEELPPAANALRLSCPNTCADLVTDHSACPVLTWRDCKDGLPCSISAEQRRKLRRAKRRAEMRGSLEITAIRDSAAFLEVLTALHSARWKERGEAGVLADERVRNFHAEALDLLLVAELARLYLLSIGGEIASAYYGLFHRNCAYAYLGGFDSTFAGESPGALLMAHAISRAVQEGAGEFDFLRGQEPYKYLWGARDHWNKRRCFQRE